LSSTSGAAHQHDGVIHDAVAAAGASDALRRAGRSLKLLGGAGGAPSASDSWRPKLAALALQVQEAAAQQFEERHRADRAVLASAAGNLTLCVEALALQTERAEKLAVKVEQLSAELSLARALAHRRPEAPAAPPRREAASRAALPASAGESATFPWVTWAAMAICACVIVLGFVFGR
jgi:hypothetical protein